ncbi:bifunctional (p)ppGpp synthetase/guanosine-3',5'-bis(diphosphate) 3'-pyrophosphohydrolase [Prosthecochloris sp. N3]|uniref:Bifunctional (P)ppGpp synthetase/guanosine-3',5'-bis(Diphosphate) 3'-pyrophosphohydrolase n=1 Tax=Prosthecochloris ethylica TaxID=2743976 RepID=A0ABR9XNB1_9CHLB|nr:MULTISPECIES: bifunctional (p)ppGpp synthetase/guanosine-3',5'-bis(diphosphate) 3'-pyrophosphohydrolase [Prosthecochloris]MBF0585652.1 bifunctional (p)ppGpp synthetase/guanosine-3',5'-bis(diphosphate) 3'-pyrophosphohydrolase [Prosthecochloris ethylica]MBF0635562.1 bifunctional (p)ppGpp synthetase/guanosine-3',5'-bis(diphosphate) 3'-pyrophosphohydrolase [Prosthecochloris ethylica]NUK46861.1 bifunctional (p)ppGpp synthetase/guanosine-3',5'-bis(diphosphate) 3'-pyrophosphohydrolase [Prosthecochlo
MLAQINKDQYEKLNDILRLARANLKNFDESLIQRAFFMCYRAHEGEKRASGEPFFHHPVEVARIMLTELPLDGVSVAAALLHDVIEDSEYTYEDLVAELGSEVADIVEGLTKISGIMINREITQAEGFRKMLLSMVKDIRVILLKFCDRLHNMRTLDALPEHRRLKIALETRDIYAPLAHRFGLGKMKVELENLAFKYIDPEMFELIQQKVRLSRGERIAYLDKMIVPIKDDLEKQGFKLQVQGRAKHLFSIYNKMRAKNKRFEDIHDLYGIRIIIDTERISDCFAAYGFITQKFPPLPQHFKDYISIPKHNGYQSLHSAVLGPRGRVVEVQIRTRRMHEFAEFGVAAHWRYKEKVSRDDATIDTFLRWARELINDADSAASFMEGFKLNLYHDEIYIFTPKGDMKTLPAGATPIDFAYAIHTEIGNGCIGAKVNGKIVRLNSELRSGDRVEIITSKNQKPKADWLKFVVTHRARLKIRSAINEERRRQIEQGRNIWDKMVSGTKKLLSDNDIIRQVRKYGIKTPADFFSALANQQIDGEKVLKSFVEENRQQPEILPSDRVAEYDEYAEAARQLPEEDKKRGKRDEVTIQGLPNIAYSYAKCCKPVPGDDIIGFVTKEGVVKIHRKNCVNVTNESLLKSERVVSVSWNRKVETQFLAGIKVIGEDRIGITNQITGVISRFDTDIRSMSLNARDGMFIGTVMIYVRNISKLQSLMDKIRKVQGVFSVERLSN